MRSGLPVFSVNAMRSWVLGSPQRLQKDFELEVEKVLLADERAGRDAAAGENIGDGAGDFLIVLAGVAGFAHQEDASFHGGQCGDAGSGHGARLRRRCNRTSAMARALALASSSSRSRLRVMRSADASRPRLRASTAEVETLAMAMSFEAIAESGGHLSRLGEARGRILWVGRCERGCGIDGAQQHLFRTAAGGDEADARFDEADVGFGVGLAARCVESTSPLRRRESGRRARRRPGADRT